MCFRNITHRLFSRFSKRHPNKCGQLRSAWIVQRAAKKLDLNEVQRGKLTTLVEQLVNSKSVLNESFTNNRQSLHELIEADILDRDKAVDLLQSGIHDFEQHATRLIDTFADFFATLDSKQRVVVKRQLATRPLWNRSVACSH